MKTSRQLLCFLCSFIALSAILFTTVFLSMQYSNTPIFIGLRWYVLLLMSDSLFYIVLFNTMFIPVIIMLLAGILLFVAKLITGKYRKFNLFNRFFFLISFCFLTIANYIPQFISMVRYNITSAGYSSGSYTFGVFAFWLLISMLLALILNFIIWVINFFVAQR